MLEFIDSLRQKPEHVRRRIATGTAVTLTGLVALGWVGALVAGNAFILTPVQDGPSLAQSGSEVAESASQARSTFSELMGAVGNAGGNEGESSLIIVEGETKSTVQSAPKEDTRTVIPF